MQSAGTAAALAGEDGKRGAGVATAGAGGAGGAGGGGGDRKVGVAYDEAMNKHRGPDFFPERPERITRIYGAFKKAGLLQRCVEIPSRSATTQDILLVHSKSLENRMTEMEMDKSGIEGEMRVKVGYTIRGDLYETKHTTAAAKLAAGCTMQLCERVASGELDSGFAVVRPPGHHASQDTCQGFCFYNSVAIAAKAVQNTVKGCKKIFIFDWDVHHGNGTQDIFERDNTILYCSIHRFGSDFYPGTGEANEIGSGKGEGFTANIPFKGTDRGDKHYLDAMDRVVIPILRSFAPDLVIISAGFDAAAGDPLGKMNITPAGYAHILDRIVRVSPKVAVVLEGGYNLDAISTSAEACLRVLLGDPLPELKDLNNVSLQDKAHEGDINDVLHALHPFWPVLAKPDYSKYIPKPKKKENSIKQQDEKQNAPNPSHPPSHFEEPLSFDVPEPPPLDGDASPVASPNMRRSPSNKQPTRSRIRACCSIFQLVFVLGVISSIVLANWFELGTPNAPQVAKKIFSNFMEMHTNGSVFDPIRANLLSTAHGRIVEIGAGTGNTLRYYPALPNGEKISWIGIEPNEFMFSNLRMRAENTSTIRIEGIRRGFAENMSFIEDESVDGVVSFHVLCSVQDVDASLAEVYRILKTGGQFFFFEHVGAREKSWSELVQSILEPVWNRLLDGCHLTRNTMTSVENLFGRRNIKERGYLQELEEIPSPLKNILPHAWGVATKAEH